MSFLRAARAALAGENSISRICAIAISCVLVVPFISCGSSTKSTAPNHSAYVTLPDIGSVLLLLINGTNGEITTETQTPQVQGLSPTGIALLPSKKFLYAANSQANTISIYSVNADATLTLIGTPPPAGSGPNVEVIDPTGKYLLVTNNFSNDISVFQIDSGTGALTPVGSPVPANENPTDIKFTHSGQFVYVTNPGIGMVTGFSFVNGVLTQLNTSPVFSGQGAAALVVDGSDRFLYVANPSASNPPPNALTVGNISGFTIGADGTLTKISGSPFAAAEGSGPSAITISPNGQFVYAVTPGSSFAIWGFSITSTDGHLVALTNSPFSLAAGGLFALFDPTGNFLYVGSNTGINAYSYNQSTGAPTAVVGSPFATGTAPGKMVIAP